MKTEKIAFAAVFLLMCFQARPWAENRSWLYEQYTVIGSMTKGPQGALYFVAAVRTGEKRNDVSSSARLYRANEAKHTTTPCITDEIWRRVFPAFSQPPDGCFEPSPDGRYLAIGRLNYSPNPGKTEPLTTTDIVVFDSITASLRVLVADGQDNRHYFFSPNSQRLLYYAHPPEAFNAVAALGKAKSYSVRLADVETGQIAILKDAPPGETSTFQSDRVASWAPDSQEVVFEYLVPEVDGSEIQLVLYRVGSRDARTLFTDRYGFSMVSFLGGERIVTAIDAKKAIMIDAATGETRELVSGQAKGISKVRVEGDRLIYQLGPNTDSTTGTLDIPVLAR